MIKQIKGWLIEEDKINSSYHNKIYAIELEDDCLIVRGGAIKLSKGMNKQHLENELDKLRTIQGFIDAEGIVYKDGLITE